MSEIRTIGILGAGLMGTNIALDFARAGLDVRITDAFVEQHARSAATLQANARQLVTHGLSSETVEAVVARVTYVSSPVAAVSGADLVIEAVNEDLALKQRLFREMEAHLADHAILASNTSSLMPSLLAEATTRPDRLLVTHYWNPAHLIPLVELVPSPITSEHTVESVRALYLRIGKRPAVVRKECLGFIGNRLQFAMLREAMALVDSGVATPEDIDTVVRYSFGRRLPITGIFHTADLAGLDTLFSICGILFPDLCNAKSAGSAMTSLVTSGHLGVKTGSGWYDYTLEEAEELRTLLFEELIRRAKSD